MLASDSGRVATERAFADGEVDSFSGLHPTTVLADRLVRRALATRYGGRLLDVGCGDGVLARTARDAGAGCIVAMDISQQQARLTQGLSRAERLDGVLRADATAMPFAAGRFDVVVANLFGGTLAGAAEAISALVSPGGAVIATGTLLCDADRVTRAFAAAGLEPVDAPVCSCGWVARTYRRRRA